MTKIEVVSYKNRAKNVVFVFDTDPRPTLEQVYKYAFEPQREVEIHHVKSHKEMLKIFNDSPTAYEHFVTRSTPLETLEFLEVAVQL